MHQQDDVMLDKQGLPHWFCMDYNNKQCDRLGVDAGTRRFELKPDKIMEDI